MSINNDLDDANLSTHQKVNAIFAGTQALLAAIQPIANVIIALGENRTEVEHALGGTYCRMCLLVESMTRLNKPADFQVALHCARCVYELHIDIVTLLRNPSDVAKFKSFTFVARFAAAEKLVRELHSQGITDPQIGFYERSFVADATGRAKFDTERVAHWPDKSGNPRTPDNWTGINLADRARAIGPSELLRYRQIYSLFCWYSHAGVVGIANLSADGLEAAMGTAHCHAQNIVFESTNLIAQQFDIYKANPALKSAVEAYGTSTARVLLVYLKQLQSTESDRKG